MRSLSMYKGLSLRGSERASPTRLDAPKTHNRFSYERSELLASRDLRISMLSQESPARQGVCCASVLMASHDVVVYGSRDIGMPFWYSRTGTL